MLLRLRSRARSTDATQDRASKDDLSELAVLQREKRFPTNSRKTLPLELEEAKRTSVFFHVQTPQDAERRNLLNRLLNNGAQSEDAAENILIKPITPKISVVMATRDRALFVVEAIKSVLGQSFQHWELIVVDDGSVDNTRETIAPLLDDSRIRYISQTAAGASAARNAGLKEARGDYVAYLDSDNLWYPNFLWGAVQALNNDLESDAVYGYLVSEHHDPGFIHGRVFDRTALLQGNYIDLNVFVHRRCLYEQWGGFDEELTRLMDWDLILRYTVVKPAKLIEILGTFYREVDNSRISKTAPLHVNAVKIMKKWPLTFNSKIPFKLLYVVWHYPQLSESYIECEIRQLISWGCHVEVWRDSSPASPYKTTVVVHDGEIIDAVALFKPDQIIVHWCSFAITQAEKLAALGLPVSVRLHGFDVTKESIEFLLNQSWVSAIYGFPQHQKLSHDARLHTLNVAFESKLFQPSFQKDRKLVVRAGAALPSKDIPLILELATRLPEFKFVLLLVTCKHMEAYVDEIRILASEMGSPVEIRIDVPREQAAEQIALSGIYCHTTNVPGSKQAAPVGMPISIAEAMATGSYVLFRQAPELSAYVGDAGASYTDIDTAANLILSTKNWSEHDWHAAWTRSVERAFRDHADELVYRLPLSHWIANDDRRTGC